MRKTELEEIAKALREYAIEVRDGFRSDECFKYADRCEEIAVIVENEIGKTKDIEAAMTGTENPTFAGLEIVPSAAVPMGQIWVAQGDEITLKMAVQTLSAKQAK